MEEVARDHGYAVVLCASSEDAEVARSYVEVLSRRQVDGLLIVPAANGHEYLAAQQSAGTPVVALDRTVEGLETDLVLVQNRTGAREAIKHLISHGRQRIAFVGDQEHMYTTRKRLQGYKEALKQAGLKEAYRLGAGGITSAEEAARELLGLPEPPTAFFAANNLIAVGVLRALNQAGLKVPEDIAFAGFDDFELAAVLHPRLTLVRQPAYELGRRSAEPLFDRLEEHQPESFQRIVPPTELVVRESCGYSPPQPASLTDLRPGSWLCYASCQRCQRRPTGRGSASSGVRGNVGGRKRFGRRSHAGRICAPRGERQQVLWGGPGSSGRGFRGAPG